jgi:hypothetical protein
VIDSHATINWADGNVLKLRKNCDQRDETLNSFHYIPNTYRFHVQASVKERKG